MQFDRILSLKWDKYTSHMAGSLDTCYEKQQFVDVSLVCKDGTILKCHKIILANASNFFHRLLAANDHPHPMIILHDIDADDLKTIINFIYCGEIQVVESEVRRILKIANILQVTGLTDIQTKPHTSLPESNSDQRESNVKSFETPITKNLVSTQNVGKFTSLRSIKVPLENTNKKCIQRRIEMSHKSRENIQPADTSKNIDVSDRRQSLRNYCDISNDNRPGTSKSPQIPLTKQKRKNMENSSLDWNYVLKSLFKSDQMPLKKLCMMDEIEITPGRTSSDTLSHETAFEKNGTSFCNRTNKILTDPSESIEVIVIKDEVDLSYDVNNDNL